ncbi:MULTISPECIES: Gfo/Idh/MocA family protein [unclassified Rathayibacter]|uniref:Gfo/Idh/MocA family protein n=1 Tax=unclassified Rathayibacter TaxID=2609250 RepID=UPI000F4BA04D|nr:MULTISPECIES: Gfo/Idh/MocA family oxidoreductase [unclassified Rathayibacter]ROP49142.1 oxidoreductase family protein [Rathayibacter sp. PhB186]ROS50741.1 oxidoreductase family protein [Rathayibacter sp. PhB185]
MTKTRYGIIGAGMRSRMYVGAITGEHSDVAELVALCDVNDGRMAFHADAVVAAGAPRPAFYHPDAVAEMIRESRIDRVIIASPDYTHAEMVVRAQAAGADVVVEKPLTIDAEGTRAIIASSEGTGKSVVVTFNYRYSPRNTALKKLIHSGEIGTVTSVHFEWVLDTNHGADYFRRWHRDKASSGGLLIHKASHHFDLVNWWIDDVPSRVFASGGLRFYGRDNAVARGLGERPERGTVDGFERDPFLLDLRSDETLAALYLENEHLDGYRRDKDVFDAGITIEDNLALVVDYSGGPTMSYSLNAHAPWEGYTVVVNGTLGRAELTVVERGSVLAHDTIDPSASPENGQAASIRPPSERLIVQRHWETAREVIIEGDGDSAHGGGDVILLRDVFLGPDDDELKRPAGYLDGVRSVAVGIAGNRSLDTGQAVLVRDLDLGTDLVGTAPPSGGAE